jgi:protein-L-isoaspartate(D-aspartate) O-methyltransferase
MFLPWFAARDASIALAIRRADRGYCVQPLMPTRFIACAGVSEPSPDDKPPDRSSAWATRALHLAAERAPDATATAIYGEVWFSSERLDGPPA